MGVALTQIFHEVPGNNIYTGPFNQSLQLETGNSKSPGGQDITGQWSLRDKDGQIKAWDKSLDNLADRWSIQLVKA